MPTSAEQTASFHISLRSVLISTVIAGAFFASLAPLLRHWNPQQHAQFWGTTLVSFIPMGVLLLALCLLRRRTERRAGGLVYQPASPDVRGWGIWNTLILVVMLATNLVWVVAWMQSLAEERVFLIIFCAGVIAPTLIIPPIAFRLLIGARAWIFELREHGVVSQGYVFTPWSEIATLRWSDHGDSPGTASGKTMLTLQCGDTEASVVLFVSDKLRVDEILRGRMR